MARIAARGRARIAVSPLDTMIAALTGSKYVYDASVNVDNAGGVANGNWNDAQGAGHGPALAMGKGAGAFPTFDAVNGLVVTDGVQNWFESATNAGFDLGHNSATIMIVEHVGAGQSLYISDGTTAKYYSLGIDAGGFKVITAGLTAGFDGTANAAITNGATRRLLMAARTQDYELTPASDPIQPNGNTYTEYQYNDVYPFTRNWTYTRQQFAAGSMKLTGGRAPNATGYVNVRYATIIHMDHRPSLAEQLAIRTYALSRGVAHPAQKKIIFSDGNSVAAAFNTSSVFNYATRLLQTVPAGYTRLVDRAPTWDVLNCALTPSGRQGQWISDPHPGTTSIHNITRMSDLTTASFNPENPDGVLIFDEILNDLVFNTGLPNQQRADIAIGSIQSAVNVALARGLKPVVKTALKTVTGTSGITPWDITGSAGGRGGREAQRALVNDHLRANWRAMGILVLWDPAGNYNIKEPTTAPYYDGVDLSHILGAGHDELAWGVGDPAHLNTSGQSAFNASYNAAYLAQTGVDLLIDGPFYVGLDHALNSVGL